MSLLIIMGYLPSVAAAGEQVGTAATTCPDLNKGIIFFNRI